ncbi:zinc ribbon domain-containing protein [Orrella sp. 11846]|uniref:zinc ribbon domain-containing protein n=1 Tax=Orrella sp. 11846 TaxID=3409913 RepID=UPI003B5B11AC
MKSVGRFFPSSKTCSGCGEICHDLTLKMRSWQCQACGVMHDRDINAAKNILRYAETVLTTI